MSSITQVFNNVIIRYATLIITLLVLFYSYQNGRYNGNYINSDGKAYYAYLTAVFIYQDLDYNFIDDYEMKYYDPGSYFDFRSNTNAGVANIAFVGLAVLFLPFFLLAHIGSIVLGLPTDGYAPLYQYAIGLAAIFYLFLALWGVKKFLELYGVGKYHIILVQVIIVFATPIYYYATVDVSFTHLYSFTVITLFFYYVKRYVMDHRAKHLYMVALLLGMVALIRPTNVMVIMAIPFLAGDPKSLKNTFLHLFKNWKQLIIASIICLLVVSIQPILYYAQVGQFFIWTYNVGGFDFTDPNIYDVLFSYRKGLFIYTPIILFSLLGFIYLFRKSKYQAITLFVYMFLVTYIISSWYFWWYGMSFGHRAYLDHYIVFALLFGLALKDSRYKIIRYTIYVITPIFIWFNMLQIYQYKNWILYWDMNEEKYWRVFLKTDKKYHGLLWREAQGQMQQDEQLKLEEKFNDIYINSVYTDDFEGELPGVKEFLIEKVITHSGNTSVKLTSNDEFSPGLITKIGSLEDSTKVFFRASAWVFVPAPADRNTFHFVSSIENDKGAYHYQGVDSQTENIKTDEWNKIEMITEVNEIKSVDDILKVYIWYTGEREIFVDDFKIEFY